MLENNCHCNQGVKCEVESCVHYENGDRCNKDTIEVNACCSNASTSDNTMCKSFMPKH